MPLTDNKQASMDSHAGLEHSFGPVQPVCGGDLPVTEPAPGVTATWLTEWCRRIVHSGCRIAVQSPQLGDSFGGRRHTRPTYWPATTYSLSLRGSSVHGKLKGTWFPPTGPQNRFPTSSLRSIVSLQNAESNFAPFTVQQTQFHKNQRYLTLLPEWKVVAFFTLLSTATVL